MSPDFQVGDRVRLSVWGIYIFPAPLPFSGTRKIKQVIQTQQGWDYTVEGCTEVFSNRHLVQAVIIPDQVEVITRYTWICPDCQVEHVDSLAYQEEETNPTDDVTCPICFRVFRTLRV